MYFSSSAALAGAAPTMVDGTMPHLSLPTAHRPFPNLSPTSLHHLSPLLLTLSSHLSLLSVTSLPLLPPLVGLRSVDLVSQGGLGVGAASGVSLVGRVWGSKCLTYVLSFRPFQRRDVKARAQSTSLSHFSSPPLTPLQSTYTLPTSPDSPPLPIPLPPISHLTQLSTDPTATPLAHSHGSLVAQCEKFVDYESRDTTTTVSTQFFLWTKAVFAIGAKWSG